MVPDHSGVRRKFWVIGWPQGRPGVNREAADYPALEKAARALLHRRRALLNEVRREGRQVMRLLTQAAERTVAATLDDILSLACSLIAVLAKPRLPGRAKRLNQRIEKLLEAFVEKRYRKAGTVVSLMTEMQRMVAYIHGSPPPDPAAGGTRTRPKAKPKKDTGTDSRKRKKPHPAPAGPDLPDTFEEFRGLVRRAFGARSAGSSFPLLLASDGPTPAQGPSRSRPGQKGVLGLERSRNVTENKGRELAVSSLLTFGLGRRPTGVHRGPPYVAGNQQDDAWGAEYDAPIFEPASEPAAKPRCVLESTDT